MSRNETPGRIVTNFCTGVGVHDVITSANFYDCRLWGLSVVGGHILGFSIDSRCRPYNTLALPCECVIKKPSWHSTSRVSSSVRIFWSYHIIALYSPNEGVECKGITQKSQFSTNISLYLGNGTIYGHCCYGMRIGKSVPKFSNGITVPSSMALNDP